MEENDYNSGFDRDNHEWNNEIAMDRAKDKRLKIIMLVLVTLLAAAGGGGAYLYNRYTQVNEEKKEMEEVFEFEKESLTDEYEDLVIQLDGYQLMDIQNDSLQDKLAQEQQRVRDLLEELRVTKATNAKRITELKNELATMRVVMEDYVRQIDSLNQTNRRLTAENQQYKSQNQVITRANNELTQQNTQLTRVVSRAARLEVEEFTMLSLNKRDRKTTIYNQIQKLQFTFTIRKNVTCEPGEKTVYVALRRPDGEVMQKNLNHLFTFEGQQVPYSIQQRVEYAGVDLQQSVYWNVEEILQKGEYTADFFIDGNLCGSYTFEIK